MRSDQMTDASGAVQRIVNDARDLTGVAFHIREDRPDDDGDAHEAAVVIQDRDGVTEEDLEQLRRVSQMQAYRSLGEVTVERAASGFLMLRVDQG